MREVHISSHPHFPRAAHVVCPTFFVFCHNKKYNMESLVLVDGKGAIGNQRVQSGSQNGSFDQSSSSSLKDDDFTIYTSQHPVFEHTSPLAAYDQTYFLEHLQSLHGLRLLHVPEEKQKKKKKKTTRKARAPKDDNAEDVLRCLKRETKAHALGAPSLPSKLRRPLPPNATVTEAANTCPSLYATSAAIRDAMQETAVAEEAEETGTLNAHMAAQGSGGSETKSRHQLPTPIIMPFEYSPQVVHPTPKTTKASHMIKGIGPHVSSQGVQYLRQVFEIMNATHVFMYNVASEMLSSRSSEIYATASGHVRKSFESILQSTESHALNDEAGRKEQAMALQRQALLQWRIMHIHLQEMFKDTVLSLVRSRTGFLTYANKNIAKAMRCFCVTGVVAYVVFDKEHEDAEKEEGKQPGSNLLAKEKEVADAHTALDAATPFTCPTPPNQPPNTSPTSPFDKHETTTYDILARAFKDTASHFADRTSAIQATFLDPEDLVLTFDVDTNRYRASSLSFNCKAEILSSSLVEDRDGGVGRFLVYPKQAVWKRPQTSASESVEQEKKEAKWNARKEKKRRMQKQQELSNGEEIIYDFYHDSDNEDEEGDDSKPEVVKGVTRLTVESLGVQMLRMEEALYAKKKMAAKAQEHNARHVVVVRESVKHKQDMDEKQHQLKVRQVEDADRNRQETATQAACKAVENGTLEFMFGSSKGGGAVKGNAAFSDAVKAAASCNAQNLSTAKGFGDKLAFVDKLIASSNQMTAGQSQDADARGSCNGSNVRLYTDVDPNTGLCASSTHELRGQGREAVLRALEVGAGLMSCRPGVGGCDHNGGVVDGGGNASLLTEEGQQQAPDEGQLFDSLVMNLQTTQHRLQLDMQQAVQRDKDNQQLIRDFEKTIKDCVMDINRQVAALAEELAKQGVRVSFEYLLPIVKSCKRIRHQAEAQKESRKLEVIKAYRQLNRKVEEAAGVSILATTSSDPNTPHDSFAGNLSSHLSGNLLSDLGKEDTRGVRESFEDEMAELKGVEDLLQAALNEDDQQRMEKSLREDQERQDHAEWSSAEEGAGDAGGEDSEGQGHRWISSRTGEETDDALRRTRQKYLKKMIERQQKSKHTLPQISAEACKELTSTLHHSQTVTIMKNMLSESKKMARTIMTLRGQINKAEQRRNRATAEEASAKAYLRQVTSEANQLMSYVEQVTGYNQTLQTSLQNLGDKHGDAAEKLKDTSLKLTETQREVQELKAVLQELQEKERLRLDREAQDKMSDLHRRSALALQRKRRRHGDQQDSVRSSAFRLANSRKRQRRRQGELLFGASGRSKRQRRCGGIGSDGWDSSSCGDDDESESDYDEDVGIEGRAVQVKGVRKLPAFFVDVDPAEDAEKDPRRMVGIRLHAQAPNITEEEEAVRMAWQNMVKSTFMLFGKRMTQGGVEMGDQ